LSAGVEGVVRAARRAQRGELGVWDIEGPLAHHVDP
jgi:hypothetical protein